MTEIKDRADAFLKKLGMLHEAVDILCGCGDFIEEMTRGLNGEESSPTDDLHLYQSGGGYPLRGIGSGHGRRRHEFPGRPPPV